MNNHTSRCISMHTLRSKLSILLLALIVCVSSFAFAESNGMQADAIYINGSIYTVNESYPWATAMVVKDGKFLYVGDNAGALQYEGPVTDLAGQFVMPGIVDSHVHIAWGSEGRSTPLSGFLIGDTKAEVLECLKTLIEMDPDAESYHFMMQVASLNGEKLTRDELDEICPEKPLRITELEQHSRWLNSLEMKAEKIDDYMPDVAAGLSYCERDEDGRINGRIFEWCGMANTYTDFPEAVFEDAFKVLEDKWKQWGVVAAFDAGQPHNDASIDTFLTMFEKMDEAGNLPYYIEGCFYVYKPEQLETAIEKLKAYNERYNTEHLKVRTMKIMMDGTVKGHTAALFDNYADTDSNGGTIIDTETLTRFIIDLNAEGIDLHVHTIGDRAIATVLDAVENAKNTLGDAYTIQVTCAHVEVVRHEDLGRFAELGVFVNFTPAWFGGNCYASYQQIVDLLGEKRGTETHRANTIWNTGATVTFSSDSISLVDTDAWNPYLGMETGMTRQTPSEDTANAPVIPGKSDCLSMAQMIKGYTINGAKQMKLDDKIGSIEVGKEASFLVFEKSLFDLDVYDIHNQLPKEFYIRGVLVK